MVSISVRICHSICNNETTVVSNRQKSVYSPFNHFSILYVSNNACFNFSNALSNKSQFLTKNPLRQIELFALNPLKENLDDEADREK